MNNKEKWVDWKTRWPNFTDLKNTEGKTKLKWLEEQLESSFMNCLDLAELANQKKRRK